MTLSKISVRNFNDVKNQFIIDTPDGFIVEDSAGEQGDSCFGFIGRKGLEYAISEAKHSINYTITRRGKHTSTS